MNERFANASSTTTPRNWSTNERFGLIRLGSCQRGQRQPTSTKPMLENKINSISVINEIRKPTQYYGNHMK